MRGVVTVEIHIDRKLETGEKVDGLFSALLRFFHEEVESMAHYRILIGLLIVFAITGRAAAQSRSDEDWVELKTTSPYEIARIVNLNSAQQKQNRIRRKANLGPIWEGLRMDASLYFICEGNCEAKIFRHELDGAPGEEVLLKLMRSDEFCRYVIFKQTTGASRGRAGWKPIGFIDHDFNKYEMARHRFIKAFGRNWLVIRGQEGSGSGYALYGDTWYEVSKKGVRATLNYPVDGHTYPWPTGVGWEFKATPLLSSRSVKGSKRLTISYSVSYTTLDYTKDKSQHLFTNKCYAHYVWSSRKRAFVFDTSHPGISEREIAAIANIESDDADEADDAGAKIGGSTFFSSLRGFVGSGYELFLKYNLRGLMRIAKGKDENLKEWLRQLLKDCEDVPEKKALSKALQH